MGLQEILDILKGLSQELVAYKLGGPFANAVQEAARLLVAQGEKIARMEAQNRWIPVTERLPEECESIVPNWGTVSKPVLVAFVCTTSEEPYPQNCVVREAMSHNGVFTHKSYSGEYKAIAWMPRPEPPAIGCVENQPVLKEGLVRCRECEYHKESPFSGLLQCTAEMGLYRHVLPDDYCIWGNESHEQKEENTQTC